MKMVILAVMVFALLGATAPVSAATLVVDPSDCAGSNFCTIQEALNAAAGGDTISIVAGVYNEALTITQPNLTLAGAGIGVTSIVNPVGGYGIFSQGHDGLTIQDLDLDNTLGTYGVKIDDASNITLLRIGVFGSGRSGVDLNGIDGALLDGVQVLGTVSGVGFGLSDCNDVMMSNLVAMGNAWGGIGIYTWGRYFPPAGSNNISLTGMNLIPAYPAVPDQPVAVYLERGNYNDPAHPGLITGLLLPEYGYVMHNPVDTPNHWYFTTTEADADSLAALMPSALDSVVYQNSLSTQNGPWNSIQQLIDAAAPGDTINLGPGIWNEAVSITKSLSLNGAGSGDDYMSNTHINNHSGYGIYAAGADAVSFSNFQLDNSFGTYGLKISEADGVTIQDVSVVNSGRTGVDLNGLDNVLVEDVSVVYTTSGVGIATTDSNNVVLRNIYTANNGWGGVAFYTWGRYYPPAGSDNLSLEGTNTILDGVYLEIGNYTDPANPGPITQLNLPDYGFAVHNTNPADRPNHWFFFATEGEANTFAGSGIFSDTSYNQIYQNSLATQLGPWNSIEAAIDRAVAGETIFLGPGVWSESIHVTKPITLVGVGSDSDMMDNTHLGAPTVAHSAVIFPEADDLTLQRLQLQPKNIAGIRIEDGVSVSGITLDDVKVIGKDPAAGQEQEMGIEVRPTGSINGLEISNTVFSDLDYGWYFFKQVDEGPGTSNVSNVTVSDTTFFNNDQKGIYTEKLSDAIFTRVSVLGNGWDDNFWNMRWDAGIDLNLKGDTAYQNITFTDITFMDNGLERQNGAALMIKARDDGATYGAHPASLNNVIVNGCFVVGNERGIQAGEPGKVNLSPTNLSVNNCYFDGNQVTYVDPGGAPAGAPGAFLSHVAGSVAINATNNWWGAYDGPSGVGTGTGEAIFDEQGSTVSFDPFYTAKMPFTVRTIMDETGGTMEADKFDFTFPAGELPEYSFVTFDFVSYDGSGPGPAGRTLLDPAWRVKIVTTDGMETMAFSNPAEVCYYYDADDLAVGPDPDEYIIWTHVLGAPDWMKLPTVHTAGEQKICAEYSMTASFAITALPLETPVLIAPADESTSTDKTPVFDWEDVPDATEYVFQIASDEAFTSPTEETVTDSTFTPSTELPYGTTWYWRVKAQNIEKESSWSSVWEVEIVRPTPVLVGPPTDHMTTDHTPNFIWEEVEGATSYVIQVSPRADFSILPINHTVTRGFFAPGMAMINQQYYWRVIAIVGNQLTNWSEVRTITIYGAPGNAAPVALSPDDGVSTDDRTPTFDWTDVDTAVRYRFQMSLSSGFNSLIVNQYVTTSEFTPGVNFNPGTYYWRVQAEGGEDASWFTVKRSFTITE
jgi:pectin methylesterase-like acyl-CoA thioesterase